VSIAGERGSSRPAAALNEDPPRRDFAGAAVVIML
jgi:hypothetical protein